MEPIERHEAVAGHPHPTPKLVGVFVNEQSVQVPHHTTGLGIKQAAIDQGVRIELNFVLSEERPNGNDRIIGDDEKVNAHPNSRFLAVAPDDNS